MNTEMQPAGAGPIERRVRPHGGARWGVEGDTRRGMEWNRHIVDNDGKTVCFMAHSDGKDCPGDEHRALLVAAAPALLDALRDLVRICQNCDAEKPDSNAPSEEEYQAAMDAAEEAIAWAGGQYGA